MAQQQERAVDSREAAGASPAVLTHADVAQWESISAARRCRQRSFSAPATAAGRCRWLSFNLMVAGSSPVVCTTSQGHGSAASARGWGPRGRRCDLRLSLPRREELSSRSPSKGIAQEPERAVRDREAVGAIPTTLTTSRRSSTGQSTSVLHPSSLATSCGQRVVVGWFSSSQRTVAGSNPAVCSKARAARREAFLRM